jgi:endonuclease/exonuclease/phosphatase family metal-dependent hydrolase
MTYNVHSCVGTDGRYDPGRIARVIERAEPDIVALQEVDVGVERSAGLDQARWLAQRLDMTPHFTCATLWGRGEYGNALLSRHRFDVFAEGCLPSLGGEMRAVQWLRIDFDGLQLELLNTHLSVRLRERVLQVGALLGSDWIARAEHGAALVVCGDFNSGPYSPVYRRMSKALNDVQRTNGRNARSTWPSVLPLLRLDHVFVSSALRVVGVDVPNDALSRLASDHLPLIVDLARAAAGREVAA